MGFDPIMVMAIGTPVFSFAGAWFGIKYRVEAIEKRQDASDKLHNSHQTRLAAHDLAIGLMQGGQK